MKKFIKILLFGEPKISTTANLVLFIEVNAKAGDAYKFGSYADMAFDDKKVMKAVDTYGHIADVFFQNSKKILEEKYQHEILDYYSQEKPLTNLLHYLFWNRAAVVKLGVWERMMKDEQFHRHIYHFFEDLKKQSSEGWEKLKNFCKENKFDIPVPMELESFKKLRQELFCN